jgi:hypothetical protein
MPPGARLEMLRAGWRDVDQKGESRKESAGEWSK